MTSFTASTERVLIDGPAGSLEIVVNAPGRARRGIALVAHPHPQQGGTLDNKVAQTLARAFVELGYVALRPNFRGVGASEGAHDQGEGETDDLVKVAEYGAGRFGALPVVLAGFSFGAFVQTRVARRLAPERMALVGLAVRRAGTDTVPADTIVIHGEKDETVLLADVLRWAEPQELPVVVVPGADHFFHRRLHIIRRIVRDAWRQPLA